ncbi:MAG: DUF4399 domain-containing protein [Gemmatimonadota bacterium]
MTRNAQKWFVCSISGSLFVLAGCAGGDGPDAGAELDTGVEVEAEAMPAMEGPRVEIVEPAEGSAISGSEVTVVLRTEGAQVVPADNRQTPGRGHHHLFLDQDLSPAGAPIPPTGGGIVHMGDASEQYTFTDVAPGEHRIIAQFAYGDHVAIPEVRTDTVTFTVAAP